MKNDNDPFEIPIDGILDLHLFRPADVRELLPDYIEACIRKNILQIRIIHGKGKGVLRDIVHSILDKHPNVSNYNLDGRSGSSWGATIAELYHPGI